MKHIYLDLDDDIVSICDRLEWTGEKQVLFILPLEGGVLENGLDLVRLRRYADVHRIEVGLVTENKVIARQALGLGLPVFKNVAEGQRNRRSWWRGRRRRELVGLPTFGGDRFAPWRVKAVPVQLASEKLTISKQHWIMRFAAILLFFIAASSMIIIFAYTIPRATITLKPEIVPLLGRQQVLADPMLPAVDFAAVAVPGRIISISQTWQGEVDTTGSIVVPVSLARGQVVLVNQTEEAVNVPEGTEVRTTGGVRFQTLAPLTMVGVISSTAEIGVVALAPGPQANVPADSIRIIDGDLAALVTVNNPAPMLGGEVREVAAVAEGDRTRLRAQVLQFLQAVALAEMEAQLSEREFLARESLQVALIEREQFSDAVGAQTDTLRLKIDAVLQATAVEMTQVAGLVYESLGANVPEGFTLVASSIKYVQDGVLAVDNAGRVTFWVAGEGVMAADLDLDRSILEITGQRPDAAVAYLHEELSLRDLPAVDVWPTWFRRMPYRAARISANVSN